MAKSEYTYESACFSVLMYEFSNEEAASDNKIKRKLKYHQLGPFDKERVDALRALRNEFIEDIRQRRYFLGKHDIYASIEDFDIPQMAHDYRVRYPSIPERDMESLIGFTVFNHYVR